MLPLLIFGGAVAVLILLTRSAQASQQLTADQLAQQEQAERLRQMGITAQPTFGLDSYQKQQIATFSAIAGATAALVTGSLALAGATAATAGPVGAAIGAVIIVVGFLRGTAHLIANDWVQKVQNPFGTALSAVFDANNAAVANGSATIQSVTYAKQATLDLWNTYKQYAEEFAQNGPDYRTVIDQSYFTLNGPNGLPGYPNGFINTVLSVYDEQIAKGYVH